MLEKTIEESDDLIRTFSSLLSIARLEAGSNSVNFALNDLQELVSDVAELYEPLAEQNNMQLVMRSGPSAQINVDRQLLGQAIANLIENVLKHGAFEHGDTTSGKDYAKITIEARLHRVENSADQQNVFFIAISDEGPGIAKKDIALVMKRFGRLEKSRSKPGTGLGLSLVSAVAKLHGGALSLEDNQPGLVARMIIPFDKHQDSQAVIPDS
ncbi:MAG: HAMP domain-containing histidine kinase [bacterium]|nr:HAMP domain-containing histidine kinase [bacterium]